MSGVTVDEAMHEGVSAGGISQGATLGGAGAAPWARFARALPWGFAGGALYAWLASRPARLDITAALGADPDDLLHLVAAVESEPDLIPFVTAVQVEERATYPGPDPVAMKDAASLPRDGVAAPGVPPARQEATGRAAEAMRGEATVSYRVETRVMGVPGWARFRKRIDPEVGRADWHTVDGMAGFRQRGSLAFDRRAGCTWARLRAETAFRLPVLGPLVAHLSRPVLAYAFSQWLRNLDAAAHRPAA